MLTINPLYLLAGYLFLILPQVHGQVQAITEYGDTIFVYDNGTWSFELLDEAPPIEKEFGFLSKEVKIDTLSEGFTFSENVTKEVNNSRDQFTVKYDDRLWGRVPPGTLNEDAEFAFKFKESDIWSVVISEETPIEINKLFLIAKKNMESYSGEDAEIIATELRTVNGTPVIRGVLKSTFSGITFMFDSYYYSDDRGSIQFTTWTSDTIWEKNQETILDLLNGLIVKE